MTLGHVGFRDASVQTDRHTDRNTLRPSREWSSKVHTAYR